MVTGLRGLRSRLLEIREYLEAVRQRGRRGGVPAALVGAERPCAAAASLWRFSCWRFPLCYASRLPHSHLL